MDKINKKYSILTPNGFSKFQGIRKVVKKGYVEIWTEKEYLKCSLHHFIKSKSIWKHACILLPGDIIETSDGDQKIIDIYKDFDTKCTFYDPMNVENKKQYFSNSIVSHNSEFLGSTNTLISSAKINELTSKRPIREIENIKIYEEPDPNRTYFIPMDPSEGKQQDYHAFLVMDITERPFRVVASWRNNTMDPLLVPDVLYYAGKMYNDAPILIETKSSGPQISDELYYTKEYDFVLGAKNAGRTGQVLTHYSKDAKGLATSKTTKSVGCSNLKLIIENDQMFINDFDLKEEISNFVLSRNTYEADEGFNDDLVMCLVMFAWATTQKFFQNFSEVKITDILQERQNSLKESFLPIFTSDGYFGSDREFGGEEDEFDGWQRADMRM